MKYGYAEFLRDRNNPEPVYNPTCGKGLRETRRGKPEIYFNTELAGSVAFSELGCRKTLIVEENAADIQEYLNKDSGMKTHVFCHVGQAEVGAAVGAETLTTVTDIAVRIIRPLADL